MPTVTGTVTKQPDEVLNIVFDFSSAIDDEVSITINQISVSSDEIAITNELVSGQNVTMKLSGGLTGKTYKVTCLVDTSDGEVLEADGKVKVKAL